MSAIHLILCLAIGLSLSRSTNLKYQITYLNTHSGIFYNDLGDASITNTDFTILTVVSLGQSFQNLEKLKETNSYSQDFCSSNDLSRGHDYILHFCENSIQMLNKNILRLEEKVATINGLLGYPNDSREKRGLFNSVSYGLKWLFGVPDASDAEFYSKSIHQVLSNESHMKTLMEKQISIALSTISDFNKTIEDFAFTTHKINNNIDLFNKFSAQTASSDNYGKNNTFDANVPFGRRRPRFFNIRNYSWLQEYITSPDHEHSTVKKRTN
ncbi:hypothetical protein RUM43_015121 [Polyplax serrata]|uniref:Uncharacterized protein n=1 Tax=Polyplax serrata TaxID=468196 RepID=A0AAN8P453_POLSC